ncbi:MAG TPA: DNA polymerase III subunit alpha [Chthonomonadaceae bacterium]|nr:DNA polymerase III subunit alpha [Chthonomonadaceae bacterium]
MANSSDFVHLHCHSEFSLLDGANRLDPLIQRAAELGMPALALTDHGVMYGTADFYTKCKSYGVKPILGVEAYVAPRRHTDKEPKRDSAAYHMVLLARNLQGYKNLLKLTSIAALEGFYYKPRIDRDLLMKYREGLIGTSACLGGEICTALMRGDYKTARDAAGFYRDLFGEDNFYIEIQNHNLPEQIRCNEDLLKIARELKLPIICSNDVHYLGSQDADAHDILLCIGTGANVNDADRLRYATQEFYLKDAEQMKALFRDHPYAVEQTLEIAERCDVELEFGRCPLPSPGIPEGYTPHAYLTQLAQEGLIRKYNGNPPEAVCERLNYELDVIEKTGFSQYILIVRDFAKFAQSKGIFFGVRGSAAGSLTSYLVDITDIDPVEYGLTFERFLNPERVQMPDVDMDFEDARRAEVIEYVTKKYTPPEAFNKPNDPNHIDPSEARVAQIITFGTLAARAVLKDAGRALGMPGSEVDRLCKMIPTIPVGMTIDKTMEVNPEFKNAYIRDPNARKLIDTAKRLEGISRHASVHAAGVIISHNPLVEYTPLTRSADGGYVTQYVAGTLEKIGLLKMDFLGLINLSILGQAVKNVEQTTGKKLDVRHLPLDDPKTYELLGNGECVGVFQLESPQMRRYIQELKPTTVRDVAAMVALYRPGPMAHIPRFIRCKHGLEPIEYPHPWLKEVLEETYGVIVYQDQVMQIARIIAGYSLGQADILRRAMGKKKKEEMVKQRANFLKGAAEKGVSEKKANEIFDLMEPFAGYAFNKAHAVCYAMVAYQTAYLKANYPVEYMAALMACFIEKSDKLVTCMEECKRMRIPVLPPDINASSADFTVVGNREGEAKEKAQGDREQGQLPTPSNREKEGPAASQAIRFGLAAIKNVGRGAVEVILRAREEGGPFASLTDFCHRVLAVEAGGVTRGTIEALIQCGAFASLPGHGNRRALVQMLDDVLQSATRAQREKKMGQASLMEMFGEEDAGAAAETIPIPNILDYPRDQLLGFERELLGLYISDHPLQAHLATFDKRGITRIADLAEIADRQEVMLGGIITSLKPFTSKKSGEPMCFFTLEDMTGTVSCTMFPSAYTTQGHHLEKDKIVLLRGRTSHRERVREDDEGGHIVEILADEVQPLAGGAANANSGPRQIHIRLDPSKREMLRFVRDTVEQYRGSGSAQEVYLHVPEGNQLHVVRTPLFAEFTEPFRAALERLLGRQTVWVE